MMDVLFNFKDPNWYYIIAISLQVAGALLLLVRFWGNTEAKVIASYYDGGEEYGVIENKVTLEKDKLQECAKTIYLNRFSFSYIVLGYILGVFGEITRNCMSGIILTIIIGTAFWIIIASAISKILPQFIYKEDIKKDYDEIKKKTKKEASFIEF